MELEFKSRRCHPRTKTWKSALTELILLQLLSYSNIPKTKFEPEEFLFKFSDEQMRGCNNSQIITTGTNLIPQGVNPWFETYAETPSNKTQSWRLCLKNYPWRWLKEQLFESLGGKAAGKIRSLCLELPLNMWVPDDRSEVGAFESPLPTGTRNFPPNLLCSPARKEEKTKVLCFGIDIGL